MRSMTRYQLLAIRRQRFVACNVSGVCLDIRVAWSCAWYVMYCFVMREVCCTIGDLLGSLARALGGAQCLTELSGAVRWAWAF